LKFRDWNWTLKSLNSQIKDLIVKKLKFDNQLRVWLKKFKTKNQIIKETRNFKMLVPSIVISSPLYLEFLIKTSILRRISNKTSILRRLWSQHPAMSHAHDMTLPVKYFFKKIFFKKVLSHYIFISYSDYFLTRQIN